MRLFDQVRRFFYSSTITRELYPAPTVEFRLRPYDDTRDRAAVLALHDGNAPDRLPPNHRPVFEAFLATRCVSFFVAESSAGEVLACGGVISPGDQVHTLLYGLVSPAWQGRRIGATLTLARLAFAARTPGVHVALINAVPKSIGYYQRFGFSRHGFWLSENGIDYPSANLGYRRSTLRDVTIELRRRGHLIDPALPIERDSRYTAKVETTFLGGTRLFMSPVTPAAPPPPPSTS